MLAHSLPFAPARTYQRLLWLALGAVLLPLLLAVLPPLVQREQAALTVPERTTVQDRPAIPAAPAPVAPPNQTLPSGLGPILNATLAADSGGNYAAAPLASPADGLRADNPAQRFATTFGTQGVRVAPVNGPGFALRATAINTAHGNIVLAATPPISDGPRVEYRQDGMTEWYVNGPRGLEQGFTLATPPAGAEQFTLMLPVAGEALVQDGDAVMIGGLRYGGLSVLDAAGATLPAHLDVADGTIRIVVDATGAQWPVTVDPTIAVATLTDGSQNDGFSQSVAAATANGVTTIVVGAQSATVGGNQSQGAAYVFTGSAGAYTQRAELTGNDLTGFASSDFGSSVAIAINNGTTTIVAGTLNTHRVYVFTGSSGGGTYTQQAILTKPGGRTPFGTNVAVAASGGTATIAVGSSEDNNAGSVYLFAGSGSSYPQQTMLTVGNSGDYFGTSVALANDSGVTTVVVGIPYAGGGNTYGSGQIGIYTGSGTSYTGTFLSDSNGAQGDRFGTSVAIAVSGGQNTIAIGAPAVYYGRGVAYVAVGSGLSYSLTKLMNPTPTPAEQLGYAVAVTLGTGNATFVAVGAVGSSSSVAGAGVFLFAGSGSSYVIAPLPEQHGASYDGYGTSVAMTMAANGDTTVVGGAPGSVGAATASFFNAPASLATIFTIIGDKAERPASPPNSFNNGSPFDLVVGAFDSSDKEITGAGVTFTIVPSGSTTGVFDMGTRSTTIGVKTGDGNNGTTSGVTNDVFVYPSSTPGTFTVTATLDGAFPPNGTTFTLTTYGRVPLPTINAVDDPDNPGLYPPTIPVNPGADPLIVIHGSGFTGTSQVYYNSNLNPNVALTTVSHDDTSISAYVPHTLPTAPGQTGIYVVNPPGPAGDDGGQSLQVALGIFSSAPAPSGSTDSPLGNNLIYVPPGGSVVLGVGIFDANGHLVTSLVNGSGLGIVAAGGGNIVATGGGNIVASGGGNIVASGGGNLITNDGGSFTKHTTSTRATAGGQTAGTQPSTTQKPQPRAATNASVGSPPQRNVVSNLPAYGNYTASTKANGIFLAPPIKSNGIPGTYTRSIAIDGISAPVTYTIINLNPHDGHPARITHLSRTGAVAGDPAFPLTVTGSGFVSGSVLSYGGIQLVTTFDSATQVHATIPAPLLNYTGALAVLVINPDPNGGASLPAIFTVTPLAALLSLTPADISPGSGQFTLKVTGANFLTGAAVTWNGTPLATTFVSATTLTAMVPANLVAAAGTAQVTVANPLGVATTALTFTIAVVNAAPPPRPGVPPVQPVPGVNPLPAGRSSPASGPPPAPIPPSR